MVQDRRVSGLWFADGSERNAVYNSILAVIAELTGGENAIELEAVGAAVSSSSGSPLRDSSTTVEDKDTTSRALDKVRRSSSSSSGTRNGKAFLAARPRPEDVSAPARNDSAGNGVSSATQRDQKIRWEMGRRA